MRCVYGIVVAAVFATAGPSVVQAGDRWVQSDDTYYAYAKVTDVQPIVRIVQVSTPRKACWDEPVRYKTYRRGYRSFTPAVVGGILGGVVGNQFGSGSGQTAMTIAGSLLGVSIARDAVYRGQGGSRSVSELSRRCEIEEVLHEEERVEGYRVTYRFQGRDYVTRMAADPGDEIRVRVQVDPILDG